MNLLAHEEEILVSDENKVVLTTHRIQQTAKDWGTYNSTVFFLEDISSIELRAQNIPALLILGGLAFLLGFYMAIQAGSRSQEAIIFIIAGLVLIVIWLITKQRLIKITANSGRTMGIDARRLSQQKSEEFLDKLQQAKSNRIDWLFKK
jgi:hypothetical protein